MKDAGCCTGAWGAPQRSSRNVRGFQRILGFYQIEQEEENSQVIKIKYILFFKKKAIKPLCVSTNVGSVIADKHLYCVTFVWRYDSIFAGFHRLIFSAIRNSYHHDQPRDTWLKVFLSLHTSQGRKYVSFAWGVAIHMCLLLLSAGVLWRHIIHSVFLQVAWHCAPLYKDKIWHLYLYQGGGLA